MMVTDDFRTDIQMILQRESDQEVVSEYMVALETMNVKGAVDSIMADTYGEVLDLIRDEMCRRFCERVTDGQLG